MTDILTRWKAYRATTHTDYESDLLGDELAKEAERLAGALERIRGHYIDTDLAILHVKAIARAALQSK